MADGERPLLVYGPRSTDYDFGPWHPLTPRRFGPGISLIEALGGQPGLAPEPASDHDLRLCHSQAYIDIVKRFSADPSGLPEAGIGPGGDNPSFSGMHDASASVAGGSMRAMEAILRGDVEHAQHPGGGLHHAMADRAGGFCVYNDVALAIAVARRAGLRVLYLDFDFHHGDGVQALHAADPGVMTASIHESGRYVFPGTGFANELGSGTAAGTVVNLPLEPFTGEEAWLSAIRSVVPQLAASFGPDVIVSQHGCDAHAWDPLANGRLPIRVTTTAMHEAARLTDILAHRWAKGRWLSTGGGGYGVYHVVPRAWSLVWLTAAHRDPPAEIPSVWLDRWAAEAAEFDRRPLPTTLPDDPNAGIPVDDLQREGEASSLRTAQAVRNVVLPSLIREAEAHAWWSAIDDHNGSDETGVTAQGHSMSPTIVPLDVESLERNAVAPRVVPMASTLDAHAVLRRALDGGATACGAIAEDRIVGLAIANAGRVVEVGVAPAYRRQGVGSALLRMLVSLSGPLSAVVTVAERDPIEPLDRRLRADIAHKLLGAAGFEVRPASGDIGRLDPMAIEAARR
jgi:acetoin utilization protein AcuC